jgi:hypothetical protein
MSIAFCGRGQKISARLNGEEADERERERANNNNNDKEEEKTNASSRPEIG